ncbi:2-dehydro-3-deoxygalactonokinase [Novosphingobium sp. 9]|uniref:2-dehydro-3-deoxygalactonokinase n=1 Tax=Novosphingobium sp. 9 TaxID=2025349 RepID=UPI0021B66D33|nr:2-dehydro-3-deoxygalactonokinase [Novosphingobium sp. 9]
MSTSGATAVVGDWGTTRLRLFRLDTAGEVVARVDGPGVGTLDPASARAALAERLSAWVAEAPISDVLICGMAGTPRALVAAGYAPCPVDLDGWLASRTETDVAGIPVAVLPGLSWRSAEGVPEVMRGEETQVFGAIALNPELGKGRHLIVLPGTHTKWVELIDGTITGYRTCPTGETFALLCGHSTMGGDDAGNGSFDEGFARGLERAAEPAIGALFEARAARMLDGRSSEWSRGYLSGVLIGGEIASQTESAADVVLIGDPKLTGLYERALAAQGLGATTIEGDAAVLAGLRIAQAHAAQNVARNTSGDSQ